MDGCSDAQRRGEEEAAADIRLKPASTRARDFFSFPVFVNHRLEIRAGCGFVTRCTGSSAEGNRIFEDADLTENVTRGTWDFNRYSSN